MTEVGLIEVVRETLADLRQKGHTAIAIENLDAYFAQLAELAKDDTANNDSARQEASQELLLAEFNANRASDLEMFRSVLTAGQASVHAGILINGGASAALLAFVGHVATSSNAPETIVPSVAWPLFVFLVGVFAATCATGMTYVTQRSYALERKNADLLNYVTIGAVVSSYLLFLCGAWLGYRAIVAP